MALLNFLLYQGYVRPGYDYLLERRLCVVRRETSAIASSGKSLMPEGFEKKIPPQEMADLLAFLRAPKEGQSPTETKSDRKGND